MVQVNRVCLKILFINRPQFLVDSNEVGYLGAANIRAFLDCMHTYAKIFVKNALFSLFWFFGGLFRASHEN